MVNQDLMHWIKETVECVIPFRILNLVLHFISGCHYFYIFRAVILKETGRACKFFLGAHMFSANAHKFSDSVCMCMVRFNGFIFCGQQYVQ